MDSQKTSTTAKVVLLFSTILFSLLLVEIGIRTLPVSITGMWTSPQAQPSKDIGYSYIPTSKGKYANCCSLIKRIHINEQGFRDNEWKKNEEGGIAILGDSFMAGFAVNNNEITSAVLEDITSIPTKNTGIAGFGTFGQIETYKKFLKSRNPQVTALFVYIGNDLADNLCVYSERYGKVSTVCAERSEKESGYLVRKDLYSTAGSDSLKTSIKKYCRTCKHTLETYRKLTGFYKLDYEVLEKTKEGTDPLLEDAWFVTEKGLFELRKLTEENGDVFVLALVPNAESLLPGGFYSNTPNKERISDEERFENFALENSFHFVNIGENMHTYIDTHNLKEPYFHFHGDEHWNPVGHLMGAHSLAKYILDNEIMETAYTEELFNKFIKSPPELLVGSEGYKQLYEGGIYK